MTLLELGYNYVILAALDPVCWYIIQDIESNHLHAWFIKGAAIFWGFFPVFFWIFSLFWGLMVLIGICSVLQLSLIYLSLRLDPL